MTDRSIIKTFDQVKQAVSREYCRSVLLIDDEAIDDQSRVIGDRFSSFQKRCEEVGICLHLFSSPDASDSPDDGNVRASLENANKLASRADFVVIDWYLSHNSSPIYSIQFIKGLLNDKGVRFVLINTKQEVEATVDELRQALGITLKDLDPRSGFIADPQTSKSEDEDEDEDDPEVVSGEEIDPEDLRSVENHFLLDGRIYITVRKKLEDAEIEDSEKLIDRIQEFLQFSFPDHLHWAALELAVTARNIFPEILYRIPKGVDGALFHQVLFENEREVANQVAISILDELLVALRREPLMSVDDQVLYNRLAGIFCDWASDRKTLMINLEKESSAFKVIVDEIRNKEETRQQLGGDAKKLSDAIDRVVGGWATGDIDKVRDILVTSLINNDLSVLENSGFFPIQASKVVTTTRKPVQSVVDGHMRVAMKSAGERLDDVSHTSWAGFRESVLLSQVGNALEPGSVLRKNSSEANGIEEFYLCITPRCDCYRPSLHGHRFLFIKSNRAGTDFDRSSRISETQTVVSGLHITWDAREIEVLVDPLKDEEFVIVGRVREEFLNRIIHRVWSFQTRFGIGTSELFRALRAE